MPSDSTTSSSRPTRLVRLLVVLTAAAVLASCSGSGSDEADGRPDGGTDTASTEAGWTFTDSNGKTHTLDRVPERIAAQSVAAGGLSEYGIDVDGVFGPLRRADGTPDPAIGLADPDSFQSLGEIDSEINLEQLAALRPEIIVTAMWGDDEYWGISDEEIDEVEQIAPVVGIRVDDRPVNEPLAEFAELAASLGADLDSGEAAKARAAFDDASQELSAALEAKPGLRVVAASGTPAEMYIAFPPAFPDLRYFQSLGMDLVEPEKHPTSGGFWETLSWEQATKYPADMILADARGGTVEQVLAFLPPTARQLPAVQADQLVSWPTVHAYGYGNVAQNLRKLTTAVQNASPDVA